MQYDEFVEQVQDRSGIDAREQAERAIRATLETLAARITGGEANELADTLPSEIGVYLRSWEHEEAQDFDLEEFFARVSRLEEVDRSAAERHSRAVMQIVQKAAGADEAHDLSAQLPAEYRTLFSGL